MFSSIVCGGSCLGPNQAQSPRGRAELRILMVDPRQLERVVEIATFTEVLPEIVDDGDARLSQEDTDNLFG